MKKTKKLTGKELTKAIKEAQKDPEVMGDIRKFIDITTGVYKLKDYKLK